MIAVKVLALLAGAALAPYWAVRFNQWLERKGWL